MDLEQLFPTWKKEWILHEDEDLVVVDKPAGVPTHAAEPDRIDDAFGRVRAFLAAGGAVDPYLGIHQRLDRDTSGVLLFTHRQAANRAMAEQFEGRRVQKTYVAAVGDARRLNATGTLRHRIAPGKSGAVQVLPASAQKGEEATTHYRVLERRGPRALVELTPVTGRTHQLRAQLLAVGAPIAGDRIYGGPPAARLLLHASALAIAHPATGAPVVFRSPQPAELADWLAAAPADPFRDVDTVEALLREAAGRRYGLARRPDTTALRIAHGAGDGLPGLSVDLYGEWLVASLFADEALAAREVLLDACDRLGARGVYLKLRPKHASVIVDPRSDAYAPGDPVRGEPAPSPLVVVENGLPLRVRLGEGLSTGVFLDQRENRRRVRELAGGARVLNLFAYTGAFTVAAVAGGAAKSVTVDVSQGALAQARENLDAISADPDRHVLVDADALVWLKLAERRPERFDLIVLDPPSFATTKKSRFSAASDYKKLAAMALALLAPGGRLLACTNHRGILRARFRRQLHEAAREAGVTVAQAKDLPDPQDFPPEPGQEPHLKSVLVTLAGERGATR